MPIEEKSRKETGLRFDITYKEEDSPIKKVDFTDDDDDGEITECQIRVVSREIQIQFDYDNKAIEAHFKPQQAIELGEMLIKLGKQELNK